MSNLKIGLQLFSIRDKMEENIEQALKTVKEIGYDYIEMAGYYGKSAEEIASLLKKYDLKCISVHQGLDFYTDGKQDAINFVKTIGAEYTAIPWYDIPQTGINNCVELFTDLGRKLFDSGIKLLYHNHDFEFNKLDDKCIIDILYNSVPKEYLNPEFDTCWIKYAGYSPVEYLEKYSDRINVVHLKDFWCKKLKNGPVYSLIDNDGNEIKNDNPSGRDFEFRPIGYGINDIKDILSVSEKIGAEYIIVEQDMWYEDDSMKLAEKSREYLKSIGY